MIGQRYRAPGADADDPYAEVTHVGIVDMPTADPAVLATHYVVAPVAFGSPPVEVSPLDFESVYEPVGAAPAEPGEWATPLEALR